MLSGQIRSQDLWRMAYNALLYSHKDTIAQGYTLWTRGGRYFRVTAFDDFFALTDREVLSDHTPVSHHVMEIDDLKTLEKELRDTDHPVEIFDLELWPYERQKHQELMDADALCFPEGYLNVKPVESVAFAPDRLRKLSLLKPQGYPIDCRVYERSSDEDLDPVIAFRYGPSVRGAMAPVNRDEILKLYQGEEVWR